MPASFVKPVTTLPAGEPGPLQTPANDSGFIHAPSMTHAATAALLRNAHLGPSVCRAPRPVRDRAVFAPRSGSLAPARRRAAGATPRRAARLPRRAPAPRDRRRQRPHHGPLHRAAAPRGAARRARAAAPTGPVDTIAAENVVDGLVLHRRWKEERSAVIAEVSAAGLGTSDLSAISSILDRLGDMIDGLSDALTAETAYQMVRGNTSRTASTLAAIAQGMHRRRSSRWRRRRARARR